MKTKQIFRTLCLVAVMCMVSANALAYDVYDDGDIDVNPKSLPCKILVVEEDATVNFCDVFGGGVLIIKEGKTVTVKGDLQCINGTIYVYGTLNIEQTEYSIISSSTVYIMQGGSRVGTYTDMGGNTISTNVDPATVGSIGKVDAQVPTPANSFVGWPDYYQRRIYSTDGTDFYPSNFEDAACTQPITDLDAWKTKYSNIYHAAYDDAYDAGVTDGYSTGYDIGSVDGFNMGYEAGAADGYDTGYEAGSTDGYDTGYAASQATLPTDPEGTAGTQVVITKDAKTLTLINPDKVKYSKVTE